MTFAGWVVVVALHAYAAYLLARLLWEELRG